MNDCTLCEPKILLLQHYNLIHIDHKYNLYKVCGYMFLRQIGYVNGLLRLFNEDLLISHSVGRTTSNGE